MSRKLAMVMDLGGTKIKLGLVEDDNLLCVTNTNAQSQKGLRERLPEIEALMNQLLSRHSIRAGEVAGIGIAIPGIVDPVQKKILSIDNKFSDAPDIDLNEWANKTWKIPLQIENDARAALIGEWKYGKGKGYDNVVLITIGTGVGTSAVIEGKVLRGKHFQAGCLGGHFTINLKGNKCNCGNYGCVEVEASTWNIERIAKTTRDFANSELQKETLLDFETIFRYAKNGNELAIQLRDECLGVWSACAVNLIHAYDPEVLIIGGGVMGSADFIIPYLQNQIDTCAWTPWGKVKIYTAENINTAALLGAAHLVLNQ